MTRNNNNDHVIALIGFAIFLIISSVILVPVYTAMGKNHSISGGSDSGLGSNSSNYRSDSSNSIGTSSDSSSSSSNSNNDNPDSSNADTSNTDHASDSTTAKGAIVTVKPPNDQSSSSQSNNFPGLSNLANQSRP